MVNNKLNLEYDKSIIDEITISKIISDLGYEMALNKIDNIYQLEGMSCAIGCAQTIQEKLTNLEGVQTATVDFDKKWATVTFDKTLQNPENITKVVQATGDGKTYKVSNMKL